MPREVTVKLYQFDELSDEAKKYARKAFVEQPDYPYDEWWAFDGLEEVGMRLGMEIEDHQIRFHLHSQGSGASFAGVYIMRTDAIEAIKNWAPEDETLVSIAEQLTALQVRVKMEHGANLCADISVGWRAVHSYAMGIDVLWADETRRNLSMPDAEEAELRVQIRRFADWMYQQLQDQYDYYFDNAVIDEELSTREFHEDGTFA